MNLREFISIALAASLLTLSGPAIGQEGAALDDEFALLEEAISVDEVESASKYRQSIFFSPSAITVFTREEIRASGAVTVADLLRRVPGFDVYEMKPSFPLVGARALTDHSNNLVLLLVDGREALIELSGFAIWAALTIDIEEIERIEIIRGPGSTLYGANAFAAVVNITTVADWKDLSADIFLSGGEQGFYREFSRLKGGWRLGGGVLSFSASLGRAGQRSAADHGYRVLEAQVRSHAILRYRLEDRLDVSLHGGYLRGGGPLYMIVGDFIARPVTNHYVMAKVRLALNDAMDFKAQLYHIRFDGRFHFRSRFYAYDNWISDVPEFRMDTQSYDGQLQLDWRMADWLHFILGGTLRYTTLDSDKVIARGLDELRGSGFVHTEIKPLKALRITLGLRVDANTETSGNLGRVDLSPRAVVVYRPFENHSFRVGYGLAFRKPSFIENQIHMQIDDYNPAFPEILEKMKVSIGNESLVNESVHSIETGWRGHFLDGSLRAAADLFYNIYVDMIYFDSAMGTSSMGLPDIPNSAFNFVNAENQIHVLGGEAELSYSPDEQWTFWGNVGLRKSIRDSEELLGTEPLARANLGLRWISDLGPVLDLAFHYVSEYEMPLLMPEEPFEEQENTIQRLGNNFLLVARLGYRFEAAAGCRLEIGLDLRAPLGAPFREYAGAPMESDSYNLSAADWAGEKLYRLVFVYLRGTL